MRSVPVIFPPGPIGPGFISPSKVQLPTNAPSFWCSGPGLGISGFWATRTPVEIETTATTVARRFIDGSFRIAEPITIRSLAAEAPSQQAGALPETLKRQPCLCEVEGERAAQYRREARGQHAGYAFVRRRGFAASARHVLVDVQDDMEGLGELLGV